MPIKTIKGMIMDVAPSNSEAIAVWMRDGFNTSNSIWRFEIKEKEMQLKLVHPAGRNVSSKYLNSAYELDTINEPWRLNHETLWEITSETYDKLKYIYVFPNPQNQHSLDNLEDIDTLINNCLDILKTKSIDSVSFILIPALLEGEHNRQKEDIESAKQMIKCCQNWLLNNNDKMNIYLVDRVDDFKEILDELNSGNE